MGAVIIAGAVGAASFFVQSAPPRPSLIGAQVLDHVRSLIGDNVADLETIVTFGTGLACALAALLCAYGFIMTTFFGVDWDERFKSKRAERGDRGGNRDESDWQEGQRDRMKADGKRYSGVFTRESAEWGDD